ncbi:hypothetical protein BH10ACT1_BH10ACT1_31040 [soil metagenome]
MSQGDPNQVPPPLPGTAPPTPSGGGWELHHITDPAHGGMDVAHFSHPTGWQAGSQVVWNQQHTSHPALARSWTVDPTGSTGVEWFPHAGCCWIQPAGFERPGTDKFGLTLLPPMAPLEAMTQFLIPMHRGAPGTFQVLDSSPVPDLAQSLGLTELAGLGATGIRVRIESHVATPDGGRKPVIDEVYAIHYVLRPHQGQVSQQNWGLTGAFTLRADRPRFDELRPVLWQIATSYTSNPAWGLVFQQVAEQLNGVFMAGIEGRQRQLQRDAELQTQLSAYNQQVRDHQSQAVAAGVAHQKVVDEARSYPVGAGSGGGQSAQDAWGDTLLGRSAYQDPNNAEGNYWYDDGSHEYVWTDGQGGFTATDDPNHDPNIGSDRSWTIAERA